MPSRALLALAAVILVGLGTMPARADAARDQASMFMDDELLLYRGDDVMVATLADLRSLGADWVRVSVPWFAIAPSPRAAKRPRGLTDPTDPAHYDPGRFRNWDHLLREARRQGIKVLFNVTGRAPLWATGLVRGRHVNPVFRPNARQFGAFMKMLGRRYDGRHLDRPGGTTLPRVDAWSIWNEPNQGAHLQPQWSRTKGGRWFPEAARIYRGLARAGLDGLAAAGHVADRDMLLLGETASSGVDRHGRTRAIRPGVFLPALLCLDRRTLRPLRGWLASTLRCDFRTRGGLPATGFAHHPYALTTAPEVSDRNRDDIALADASRLARLLDAAARAHRLPSGLPYWWTEFGYETPPEPRRGVDPVVHARRLARAEMMARADARSAALTQFLLRDDGPAPGPSPWRTFQSGLLTEDGERKPAYDAYRLPLVSPPGPVPPGGVVTLWGLVRPRSGAGGTTVRLQFARDGTDEWTTVRELRVDDAHGAFTATVTTDRTGAYRFLWSPPSLAAAPGVFGAEPATPASPPVYASVPAPVVVG